MFKKLNHALAVVLTLTMVISLFAGLPPKAQAEEKNTYEALPAPPMIMPAAVNPDYPQMEKPVVEAHSNGDGTGYLDVSWNPVEGAEKYQVILFNGSYHSYWDVPATETSWTTQGKGMFPTPDQVEAGQVDFMRNGSGQEFIDEPSYLYLKANELNGGFDYSASNEYYIRLTAVYEDGATPISYATTVSIPLESEMIFEDEQDALTDEDFEKINQTLIERGFNEFDLENMPPELKEEIFTDGGTNIESEQSNIEFSSTYSDTDPSVVTINGDSFEEIEAKAELMPAPFAAIGDTSWDKHVGNWKGKIYVTYIGETSKEYRYFIYSAYQWNAKPFHAYTKDQFGAVFQSKATKYASNRASGLTVRSQYKKNYNYSLPYETTTLTSIRFVHDWKKFPNVLLDYTVGYGKLEVRYPKRYKGETASLIGYYYHPWYVPSLSVGYKNMSVDFPLPKSNKWRWDETFKIGGK